MSEDAIFNFNLTNIVHANFEFFIGIRLGYAQFFKAFEVTYFLNIPQYHVNIWKQMKSI